jgi:hypothetical protein
MVPAWGGDCNGRFRTFIENDIARWTSFVAAVGLDRLKGGSPQ